MARHPCRAKAAVRDGRGATIAQVAILTAGIVAVVVQLLLA